MFLVVRQIGSNCPNCQILNHHVGQLEPPCQTIGTPLSENWNHLVGQFKTLGGETSSYLREKVKSQESRVKSQESIFKSQEESRVKSQESRVKIGVWDNIQKSKVKKEIQHPKETSNQNSSYLNPPGNNSHVTRNMLCFFAILIDLFECYDIHMLKHVVSPMYRFFLLHPQQPPSLPFLFLCVWLN